MNTGGCMKRTVSAVGFWGKAGRCFGGFCLVVALASSARAADGAWSGLADGNWSDTANWQDGALASGSGATAFFTNGAAVTVWQDLGSLTLGNLFVANASILITNNPITLSGGGTSVVTVAGAANTATVSVALSPAGGTRMVKNGDGTFRLNRNPLSLGGLTLNSGVMALTFGENNDGLNVGYGTITVNSGATLFTGGNNQINNQAVVDVKPGGVYDLNGKTDNIGAITGDGVVSNAPFSLLFWPNGVTRVFSGTISGNSTFEPRQTGLTVGGSNSFQSVWYNLYLAGALAFAPGVDKYYLGGLSTTNDQTLALQDTAGNPVTLALGSRNTDMTLRIVFAGPGGLEKVGAQNLTLTNAHSYAGLTTVSGGTLRLGDGARDCALTNSSGLAIKAGTVAITAAGDQAYAAPVSGAGALTKAGAGTLALNNFQLAAGSLTANAGAVAVNGGNSSGVTYTVNSGGALRVNGGTGKLGGYTVNTGAQLAFNGGSSTGATLTANAGTTVEFNGGMHLFASPLGGNNRVNRYVQSGGTAAFTTTEGMGNTNWVHVFVSGGTLNIGSVQCRGSGLSASGTAVVNMVGTHRVASDGTGHAWVITNDAAVIAQTVQLMSNGANASTGTLTLAGGTLALTGLDNSQPNAISPVFVNFDGGLLRFLGSYTVAANTNSTFAVFAGGARIDSGSLQNQINQPLVNGTGGGADGGLTKSGASVLVLATNAAYTGLTTVKAGTLRTISAGGAPFGSGPVFVNGGTLQAQPAGSGLTVNLALASGAAGNTVAYGAGPSLLSVSKMSDSSVTLTLGNSGAAAESVLVRTNSGVLAVLPANGTATLGSSEKVVVNGGVATVNGMASAVFGVHNTDDRLPCDFLTYGANGFQTAPYTAGLGGGAASIANVTTNSASDSAQVYALRVSAGAVLTVKGGQTLTVGDGAHPAGVILNNSSAVRAGITGGTLDFGTSEGLVIFNLRHQNNNAPYINSVLAGQSGVTFAAGGSDQDIYLGSAGNTYSGGTRIMNGCLSTANALNLGSGDIYVYGNEGGGGQYKQAFAGTVTNAFHLSGVGGTPSGTAGGAVRFDANGTLSGPVELMADARVGSPSPVVSGTFSGSIYGPYALEIGCPGQGWGRVRFAGVNTYSGQTLVSGGTLEVGEGGSLGSGPVVNNGTLLFSGAADATITNAITGSGRVVQSGTGTLRLESYGGVGITEVTSGALAVSGGINPSNAVSLSGTLDLRGSDLTVGRIGGSGTVSNSVGGAVTLTLGAGNANSLFLGSIKDGAGTLALTKTGSGTLTLSGLNTYSGATVIGAGSVRLQAAQTTTPTNGLVYQLDASVPASLTLSGTNVSVWADVSGAGLAFTQTQAHLQPVYVTNAINGLGAVRFNGLMTNRMVAAKAVNAQTVFIVNRMTGYMGLAGVWGRAANDLGIRALSASSWQLNGDQNDFTTGGEMFINGVAGSSFTAGAPHILSALSPVQRTGWSTAIGDYWGSLQFRRAFTGDIGELLVYGTLLSGGERQTVEQYLTHKWMGVPVPSVTNVLPVATALVVSNTATLDLNGISQAVGSLSGAGAVTSSNDAWSTLTVGSDGNSTVFSDVLSGSNALVKVGGGTLTLGGASTYSGDTLVSGGTLRLAGGANRLPADSDVTVAAGAALDLNGQAQTVASIGGSGSVLGGALAVTDLIAPGGIGAVGTLTLAETPALSSVTLRIDTRLDGDCDVLAVTDDLDLSQLTLQIEDAAQLSGLSYVIATCSGALTGSFAGAANLPGAWHVKYDRSPGAGEVLLIHNLGTMILLR